jgi:Tfp pilus assembly protein PilW
MVISWLKADGVKGVLAMMIGLLVLLIIAVLVLGVETRQRRLEAIS